MPTIVGKVGRLHHILYNFSWAVLTSFLFYACVILTGMKKKNAEETNNPCLKEQELSFKCFDRHNYDKEKCFFEIENYKACKKFWGEVRAYRRRQGLTPVLPPVEEREKIKQEYLESMKKKN